MCKWSYFVNWDGLGEWFVLSFRAINHFEAAGALHVRSRFGENLAVCGCKCCFQALQHSSTVLGAASGTGWCDDLDLRQPPRGCSGAEGQNVRDGLCKTLWLQECVCVCRWVRGCVGLFVCVRGKVHISDLCCVAFTCSCHLLVGLSVYLVPFKDSLSSSWC